MQNDDNDNLPFSQRNGLAEIPPQLKIGEVSDEFRRLLDLVIIPVADKNKYFRESDMFDGNFDDFYKDLHVRFFKQMLNTYKGSVADFKTYCHIFIMAGDIPELFDFIEFLIRYFRKHHLYDKSFEKDLCNVFIDARAAYRIVDDKIMAIGTEEQGKAVERALDNTEKYGAKGARSHLISSGMKLRNGNWADSIRDSIHAVESVAVSLDEKEKTLGDALKKIEKTEIYMVDLRTHS